MKQHGEKYSLSECLQDGVVCLGASVPYLCFDQTFRSSPHSVQQPAINRSRIYQPEHTPYCWNVIESLITTTTQTTARYASRSASVFPTLVIVLVVVAPELRSSLAYYLLRYYRHVPLMCFSSGKVQDIVVTHQVGNRCERRW